MNELIFYETTIFDINRLDMRKQNDRNFANEWQLIKKSKMVKSAEGLINPVLITLPFGTLNIFLDIDNINKN